MGSTAQREITLDEVTAFHQQLLALHQAGLEFDLGHVGGASQLPRLQQGSSNRDRAFQEQLDQIVARLDTQSRGRQMTELLSDARLLSTQYRVALEAWCRGDEATEALDALHRPAFERHQATSDIAFSFVQPIVIIILLYFAWILLVLVTAPRLESLYQQLGRPPSESLQILIEVRRWLPVWGPAFPVSLALLCWLWHRRSRWMSLAWLPGNRRAVRETAASEYAANLARLIESNHTITEAVAVTGPWSPELDGPPGQQLLREPPPPILNWALSAGAGDVSMPEHVTQSHAAQPGNSRPASALRLAARLYSTMADQHTERRRAWLPVILAIVIGGGSVLIYCLALFVPLVTLLLHVVEK